jgi:predicted AlkP superfamily pyrophosphatase or phosphodiesterase
MRRPIILSVLLSLLCAGTAFSQGNPPHNLVLFVPDGLRGRIVDPATAPAMADVRDKGVNFSNSHSLFPTFTTANASGLATGHYLGDTGDFSNTIYTGYPVGPAHGTVTPFLESDPVILDADEHFGGDYLNEETLLKLARAKGYSTAAIGKLGPILIFDHTDKIGTEGLHSIIIDDSTGGKAGVPLSDEMKAALSKADLPLATPSRGENGKSGDARTPGTLVPNTVQQAYLADVAAKVVLPMFKARNKPFVLVFWSRDPDGSQHNHGDSLNTVTPGINGPTSLAGIRNADNNLAELRQALDALGLAATTDIIISSDHGFSTISKESRSSPSAKTRYADTPKDFLPMGFLAIDLARALKLPLFDPNDNNARVADDAHPKAGNGLIGNDPAKPDLVVATNGGSDLIYLPNRDGKLAGRIVKALLDQDYVSGIFVDDDLGKLPGTLPLSQLFLRGNAVTPHPAIVVNFRSYSSGCERPTNCSVEVADTVLRQGQGMHGSFSRGDTLNFTAAIGPDFKAGYVDALPVSNADVGVTAARLLGLTPASRGHLIGRVMTEAMPHGAVPRASSGTVKSKPAANGLRTVLNFQRIQSRRYFDAAGFPGRTLGLDAHDGKQKTARQ